MLNRFKRIILFSAFCLLIICPATSFAWHDYSYSGDWDYHGSGRDHPYSAYIDRYYYIGPADYAPPDYIDYINNVPPPAIVPVLAQPITQVPAPPAAQSDEFTINIPNDHGGYTAVVIKRSGNGFTGPQGEFYPQFPTVSQLKIIYGKLN
jgi:hypothetical protein